MSVPPIYKIREQVPNEEIDYDFLMVCLQDYAAPRDVVTRLLARGDLIRIKKGIYVFGKHHRRRLVSVEVLANQIYGPSYLSREYALQYHGLIPEGVEEVTCMTTKRNKSFQTPLGHFSYKHLALARFRYGVRWVRFSNDHGALIATPEKALVDFLYTHKEHAQNTRELTSLLVENYRIDSSALMSLNIGLLASIVVHYGSATLHLLPSAIAELKDA